VDTSTQYERPDEVSDPEYGAGVDQSSERRDQLARKLVRYALSCEHSRTPIRRADIAAKVLGTSSRQFRPVFAEAQRMLQDTFGMEMAELPKAEKVTAQQKRGGSREDSLHYSQIDFFSGTEER
jgi:melanoma-associated antigen